MRIRAHCWPSALIAPDTGDASIRYTRPRFNGALTSSSAVGACRHAVFVRRCTSATRCDVSRITSPSGRDPTFRSCTSSAGVAIRSGRTTECPIVK